MANLIFLIMGIVIVILFTLDRKNLRGWKLVVGINVLSIITNGLAVYFQYIAR